MKYLKTKRLSRDYFIFAAIIALALVSLSVLWTAQTFRSLNKDKELRHESEAIKLSGQLQESFDYLESFMRIIGNDISRLDNPTPEKVAPLLQKSWPRMKTGEDNYFAWSVLDFSNPQGEIIASSLNGVMEQAAQLPKNRTWLVEGPKHPGKLIFSAPDIGVITNQYVMPVGLGIVDKKGRYTGAISISFNINSLTRKLDNVAGKQTSFILLDNNEQLISQSSDNKEKFAPDFFKNNLKADDMKGEQGKFMHPIVLGNFSYPYYKKIPNYPVHRFNW